MAPESVEIADVEPQVVDLTINHDHPILSVRMPIYKLKPTHETDFFEIQYKMVNGNLAYEFNLSPHLIQTLYSSQAALANLPLMQPDQVPHGFTLGLIDNVFIAVKKLKEFHDRAEWRQHLAHYVPPQP
jgi:hypothetical protein